MTDKPNSGTVSVSRELLTLAVTPPSKESPEANERGIIIRGRAQAELRAILAQPAEQQQESYPGEDQLEAAGLGYPISKGEAVQLWYQGVRSPVITQAEVWEAMGSGVGDIYTKGELLAALRHMNILCASYGYDAPHGLPRNEPTGWGTYALKGSHANQLFLVPGPDCPESRRIDMYATPFPLFRDAPAQIEQEAARCRHLRKGGMLTITRPGPTPDECTVLTGSDADAAIDAELI